MPISSSFTNGGSSVASRSRPARSVSIERRLRRDAAQRWIGCCAHTAPRYFRPLHHCSSVDREQQRERGGQHHRGDRRRAGVVVLLQLRDDQQRRDLRLHRHVAGDEHHRAVLAQRPGERQARSRSAAPAARPAGSRARTFASEWRPGWRPLLPISRSISSIAGCSVRTTNGRPMNVSAIDDAQRRERRLDAQRLQVLAEPAVLRVDGRQRDARDGRRQRERQVDHARR